MTKSIFNSDYLGAAASGLCIIHCLLTPVLFVVQASSSLTCSEISPGWWSAIDYLFLAVTFFAIRATTRSTTSGMDSSGFVSVMGIPLNSNSQRFFRPFTFVSNDQVYTCRTIGHAASVQFELLSVRG